MNRLDAIARANALTPALRERAREAELERRIPSSTIDEIRDAGLFKLTQPKRWGGYELDACTFLDVAAILASACGSTGWVYSVLAVHNWQLACMSVQAQDDVWGDDPEVLMASSYTPRGVVEREPGGYRLSGRWSFSSGCAFARWALVGGVVDEGAAGKQFCTFLVPIEDYQIVDVWQVMGLQGTGSNDLVVEGAFVPDHRVHRMTSGSPVSDSVLYKLPFTSIFCYSLTATILGMATGALEEHLRWTRHRKRLTRGTNVADETFSQLRVAEASSLIDAGYEQMHKAFADLERALLEGDVSLDLRGRVRRDQVQGVAFGVRAIDLVFENSGASAIKLDSPIQRFWRDAHAARMHNSNVGEPILAAYGSMLLGLPVAENSFQEAQMKICSLGYVRFESTEVDAWTAFGRDALGFMTEAAADGESVSFRLDERQVRIVVRSGPVDRLTAAGWEVRDAGAFEDALGELEQAGVVLKALSPADAAERRVEAAVEFDDPSGNRLELYYGPLIAAEPPILRGVSGFLTGERGLGHIVLPAREMQATFEFYTKLLGFRHRDSMLVEPAAGAPYRMRFLGCNPRHHSVALTEATSSAGIRHLMVNAATITDVGRMYDRCRASAATLRTSLGQHSNDEMVSFYVAAPGGIEIECATLGRDVDDATWTVRELEAFRLWGYQPPIP